MTEAIRRAMHTSRPASGCGRHFCQLSQAKRKGRPRETEAVGMIWRLIACYTGVMSELCRNWLRGQDLNLHTRSISTSTRRIDW